MKNSHKGFISPLLLALIAILLVGGGVYVYLQSKPASQSAMVQNSDWKTYTNTQYGFEFKYPDINARLKTVGGWTDTNEPKITSKTPFNYNECVSEGEGPGMSGSKITIAGREYCLITISGVEVGTFSSQYEYISRIANEDIGIVFSFSGNRGTGGQQVDKEAQALFSQILATFKLSSSTMQTAGWKTYTNTKYGFEVQYPDNYQTYEVLSEGGGPNPDSISFATEPTHGYSLLIPLPLNNEFAHANLNARSLDDYKKSYTTKLVYGHNVIIHSQEEIVINGLKALKQVYSATIEGDDLFGINNGLRYIFYNGEQFIILRGGIKGGSIYSAPNEKILDQVASTFKFTP